MHIESIKHGSDSSVDIQYRDETKRNGGVYNVSVYVENNQIMVKAENSEWVVTTAPFED